MLKVYELIKTIIREKANVFIRGAIIGGVSGAMFFFSKPALHQSFILAFILKLIGTGLFAFVSGFCTAAANDAYKSMRGKK